MDFQIEYPCPMDDGDWAIQEAKGWIDVTVTWDGGKRVVSVYDQTRLIQTIANAMKRTGYFAETSVVVVPKVTREDIAAAIASLADRDFIDI